MIDSNGHELSEVHYTRKVSLDQVSNKMSPDTLFIEIGCPTSYAYSIVQFELVLTCVILPETFSFEIRKII